MLAMIDFHAWETYVLAAIVAIATALIKKSLAHENDITELKTIIKYYIERQTQDAAVRLDKANPAPADIRALVQTHIRGQKLNEQEFTKLRTWLAWTGTGNNPDADSTERSAALQLLTGIETVQRLSQPKKRWWQFI